MPCRSENGTPAAPRLAHLGDRTGRSAARAGAGARGGRIAFEQPRCSRPGVERNVFEAAHSLLARDPQHFVDRGDAGEHLARPSSRMPGERARVALELVLAGAVVDHGAHGVVDDASS